MLYLAGFFLLFIILFIIIVVFVFKRQKTVPTQNKPIPKHNVRLYNLLQILKTEKKDLKALDGLVEKMIKYFPFPENEQEANEHFEFVYFYAKSPLATAKMIVSMQKKVSSANPKYSKQIEDFQMRGVEARK